MTALAGALLLIVDLWWVYVLGTIDTMAEAAMAGVVAGLGGMLIGKALVSGD